MATATMDKPKTHVSDYPVYREAFAKHEDLRQQLAAAEEEYRRLDAAGGQFETSGDLLEQAADADSPRRPNPKAAALRKIELLKEAIRRHEGEVVLPATRAASVEHCEGLRDEYQQIVANFLAAYEALCEALQQEADLRERVRKAGFGARPEGLPRRHASLLQTISGMGVTVQVIHPSPDVRAKHADHVREAFELGPKRKGRK